MLGVAGFATFLLLLELIPRIGLVSPKFLPPFSEMIVALALQLVTAEFWLALLDTLRGWFLGLGIAVVLGVVVGIAIGIVPVLRELTASTIEFLRPIPSVALIPLAVLMFDTNLGSVLMLVVYASFWQVLVQTLYGVHDVDPVARETARSFRLSWWSQVRYMVWPSALPYVMTGLRLAASVALILAITAELIIGAPGLGNQIGVAQSGGAIAAMYALVLVTGGLGVGVNVLFRRIERWALRWHQSVRREVMA